MADSNDVGLLRWDALIHNRERLACRRFTFSLFEISQPSEVMSTKWSEDLNKLTIGCRDALLTLKEFVNYDQQTLEQLTVTGVIQSGES